MRYFTRSPGGGRQLRPPDLYEYSIDNYWFRSADLEHQPINRPLRGKHRADIAIVGGGYTGLSAAYHLRRRFPDRKILIVEGARCGYGASGRNGGFCIATEWTEGAEDLDPESRRQRLDVAAYGLRQIKYLIAERGLECDLEEVGMLDVALSEKQVAGLAEEHARLGRLGLESALLRGDELRSEIVSPLFKAGLVTPYGAILDPAKLAVGMKRIVEEDGAEIRERTVVTRITPGRSVVVETELGEVHAPVLVIATNAYSHKLGFFRSRVIPIAVFQIATVPLTESQWAAIGWRNRRGLADASPLFSYSRPTADGRIVMGGVNPQYYSGDRLASGNDRTATEPVERVLVRFFPQLEGLEIEHRWGGTTALTIGNTPSVGVTGEHGNVYFGVGFSEGVPSTQTAGRMIADLMAGEANEFTDHYVINRRLPWAGPTALRGPLARGAKWLMRTFDMPLYR